VGGGSFVLFVLGEVVRRRWSVRMADWRDHTGLRNVGYRREYWALDGLGCLMCIPTRNRKTKLSIA
jgi:hypothetical protein